MELSSHITVINGIETTRLRRPVTAVGRVKRRTAITAIIRAMASAPTGTAMWALETLPTNAIQDQPVVVVVFSAASSPAIPSPVAGVPSPLAPLASPPLLQMGYETDNSCYLKPYVILVLVPILYG